MLLLPLITVLFFLNQAATTTTATETENTSSITQEASDNAIVQNEEDLRDWFNVNFLHGGTVSLGTTVEITQDLTAFATKENPIIIDTGAFGLIFNGGEVFGNVIIRGEGVSVPVVHFQNTSWKWMGNWNNVLTEMNITATERNGVGGTALRISAIDNKDFNVEIHDTQGIIRSYGTNAIGIQLDIATDLYFFQVEVSGKNSAAIVLDFKSTFYYFSLKSEGLGGQVARGDKIILDTCISIPEPEKTIAIKRQVLNKTINQFYLPIKQNKPLEYNYDLNLLQNPIFMISGNSQFSEEARMFPIIWDYTAFNKIDTATLGKTTVYGKPSSIF